MDFIYLDHAATTPVLPTVNEKMFQYNEIAFGNPSSIHQAGRQARKVLDEARQVIAKSIHANENEIIFTGGGTEADNLAIVGAAKSMKKYGNHIITTQIEHHAVLSTCQKLEDDGYEVTYLPVDENGRIKVEDVQQALTDKTILVTIMYVNNEVGTIQPIQEIGKLLENHQAVFHTDAVQAFGHYEIDVNALKVDLLSASSHKINGPKGCGFLYQRAKTPLSPQQFGGEQERKRRAGTENMTSIVGFAEAVLYWETHAKSMMNSYKVYREHILRSFEEANISFQINSNLDETMPHILNLSFPNTHIEPLLMNLDLEGVCVSSGSACTAGSVDPSHVLVAMYGEGAAPLTNSVRVSFGYGLTMEHIEHATEKLIKVVKRLQKYNEKSETNV